MSRTYRVEVFWRGGVDGRAVEVLDQISHLGISSVASVRISNLYFLRGRLLPSDIEQIATGLLVDPVVEGYRWEPIESGLPSSGQASSRPAAIEVSFHPGVTDPVATHLLRRAPQLGIHGLEAVTTGTRYELDGELASEDLERIASGVLCNEVIQSYEQGRITPQFVPEAAPSDEVEVVPIRQLADDELVQLSLERVLFLSLTEMQTIQAQFRALGRDPTDVELETLAQTWSEHCLHKSFKADIDYRNEGGTPRVSAAGVETDREHEVIPGLISTYLRAATDRLAKPWVRSAFVDNAGIIDFDKTYALSFKVETHNHPSALEPFGGANTGVGGVIRDVIGVSARPIANTDVLCFAPFDMPEEEIPEGTLAPRRIARGVVAGIEDYGNKMGIPTVNGAILYDTDYVANPLVYCGCVGIAPKGAHRRNPRPGDLCVALGGRTGRDGLHGATFSSAELTHETGTTVGSVVQIGDPITEKAVLDAVLATRDEGLYTAITDCGAGGFSSAVGEMGESVGVDIDLQDVPLKYPGLRPWEIWLSEAQERMVLAVPAPNLERLGEICATHDVEWTVIGRFTGDRHLRVHYGKKVVADLPMEFLHHGWPRLTLEAVWEPPDPPQPSIPDRPDLTAVLLRALAHPDVASKERVIRRYDHEVQGAAVLRPLVGVMDDGPSDAAVLKPLMTEGTQGLAIGCGINPHYGRLDPYAMAWAAVDEALRNVVAVGADPDRVALLDNFCWGNPALPDRLGGLVRAAQGCHDAALAYGTPFISGKDSLNNEFTDAHGDKRTIPPTLLISSLGIVPDIGRVVTMDLKRPGNRLYLLGETRPELGGSLYHRLHGGLAGLLPAPVLEAQERLRALHSAIVAGCVRAVHDLSEGGLAVAAAEMCIGGQLGADLSLASIPEVGDRRDEVVDDRGEASSLNDQVTLFSESSARFLIEVSPEEAQTFERLMTGQPCAWIGSVSRRPVLRIRGAGNQPVIEARVDTLRQRWQSAEVV
ncbi:MAG: phosphoribosylformylglycinamidine synthase subunit PurL [Anaerolineae bacterium]